MSVNSLWVRMLPRGIGFALLRIYKIPRKIFHGFQGLVSLTSIMHRRNTSINKDGRIDANNDRLIIGHTDPDWTAGFTNTFNYKNFEFSAFIYSRWGQLVNPLFCQWDSQFGQSLDSAQ